MLIKNGLVLKKKTCGYCFERSDIRIDGTVISEISPSLAVQDGERVLSADKGLVVPGLINAHVHSYTNLLKGCCEGEPLELWSLGTVALGACMTERDMCLSARLGMAEMLRNGVTACIDHIPHAFAVDAIAQEYLHAGFRAGIAPMLHDRSDHFLLCGIKERLPARVRSGLELSQGTALNECIAQYRRWISEYSRADKMLSVLVAPNSAQRCTEELLHSAGELAQEYSLCVHTHLLETLWQRSTATHDGDPVKKMERAGLLSDRTSLAHCVWLSEKQRDTLAEHNCIIVHNPTSNLFLSSGSTPIAEYLRASIRIAFGSDGCNCGIGHNMLEISRDALFMQRKNEPNPQKWLQSNDAWQSLTMNGAATLGMEEELGETAIGKRADISVWEANVAGLLPQCELSTQCIYNLSSPNVRHVVINGNILLEDGHILAFDEQELYSELAERSREYAEKFSKAVSTSHELHECYMRAYCSLRGI